MSIPIEKLTEAVLALPSDARALLADRLVESLDPLTDEGIRDLWATEALRRRDEIRKGKTPTIPSETALAQVRNSIKTAKSVNPLPLFRGKAGMGVGWEITPAK